MKKNNDKRPVLSLILCSRNDEYMGNSRWRLETALNYVADQIEALGRTEDVEVLVADWGSEVPLREVLRLTPAAAGLVSFLLIPPETARRLQKDSVFAEVFGLNVAARRSRGLYIGRIDQDTLVGRCFLEVFFKLYEGKLELEIPLDRALLFSNRRAIPYWFAVRCPKHQHLTEFIRLYGSKCDLTKAKGPKREFWMHSVGIWLVHREIWAECGGYDERYIYLNWQEVEMILRLRQRYTLVDLGRLVGYDFYHLDHRKPRAFKTRKDLGHQVNFFDRRNLDPGAPALPFHPNSSTWGQEKLKLEMARGLALPLAQVGRFSRLVFEALVVHTKMQLMLDKAYNLLRLDKAQRVLVKHRHLWTHRARKSFGSITQRVSHKVAWDCRRTVGKKRVWIMTSKRASGEGPLTSEQTMTADPK